MSSERDPNFSKSFSCSWDSFSSSGCVSPTNKVCRRHDQRTQRLKNANEFLSTLLQHPEALELWEVYSRAPPLTVDSIQESFIRHMVTTVSRTHFNFDNFAGYHGIAHTLRDRLIINWNETQQRHTAADVKRVYYLSLEFLMGRSLDNVLLNLDVKPMYQDALCQLKFCVEDIFDEEHDAALGNGGLGRLAACYMDSLASLDYPAWGYGLRYQYGMFKQKIRNGFQYETPDYWLNFNNPWEVPRTDVSYPIRFYGQVVRSVDPSGETYYSWEGGETVLAVAYDVPIPGFKTKNTLNIRLWSSKPDKEFDLESFNAGNYSQSVSAQQKAENITSVLYPNDQTTAGKELRLKQQYFFISATLKDILRRFKKTKRPWNEFDLKVAIQLNDTHPALAIPELQRLLVDKEKLRWDEAWTIVQRVFSFTNHTVLPEALEKWNLDLVQRLLPRHIMIIYDINLYFLQSVEKKFPEDREKLSRMSIIEECPLKMIRMANLAVVGSHTVNGVAKLHSDLIKKEIFKDFVDFYGDQKFQNKTNGITQRRWLNSANPLLTQLITKKLGNDDFLKDLTLLKGLSKWSSDEEFQHEWFEIKTQNKQRLANYIKDKLCIDIDPLKMLFDVQVKRMHEYKRQFMNILYIIHRYLALKKTPTHERKSKFVPRAVIFGGKAAPGYFTAKLVIKLINSVAAVVNADPDISDYLKVVFIPDYCVSIAELIVPASDISQHISTAGTEASGTSNMKFVLNGGVIVGTLDGANIEIMEEVGAENIFIFGCRSEQVADMRHEIRFRPKPLDARLAEVIEWVQSGYFCDFQILAPLFSTLTTGGDYYLVTADFASYAAIQHQVDEAYRDRVAWIRRSIECTAHMGKFSSDRAIAEYARDIWRISPIAPTEISI